MSTSAPPAVAVVVRQLREDELEEVVEVECWELERAIDSLNTAS